MNRYNIREFSWYQYVDIGCDPILFNSWKLKEKTGFVLHSAKAAALLKAPEHSRELFANTFEVLTTINDALDFSAMIAK